jgi:hypothetical protein
MGYTTDSEGPLIEHASGETLVCALIDGAILPGNLAQDCVVRYFDARGLPLAAPFVRDGPGIRADMHASACAQIIERIHRRTDFFSIRAFSRAVAPARRILLGIELSLRLGVAVVCVPSAIDRTAYAAEIEYACRAAADRGIIVVAGWPSGYARALPGDLSSVLGVTRLPAGQFSHPTVGWDCEHDTVFTTFPESYGCAAMAGLALLYRDAVSSANVGSFRNSLREFVDSGWRWSGFAESSRAGSPRHSLRVGYSRFLKLKTYLDR